MELVETQVIPGESKRDHRGRRIISKEDRDDYIARYNQSGMTQRAFCEKEGLVYTTFLGWLHRARHENPEQPKNEVIDFTQMSFAQGLYELPLEVVYPDGLCLRGRDASSLAELARLINRQD